MSPSDIVSQADQSFQKSLEHLRGEYSRLQIGRASAALVEGIKVDAYGTMQPLKAVANIAVPDAKTVQIQCWDKSLMSAVEKAIQISDIGINPVNDGVYIRLNVPPLTEDRRKDLVKVVHRMAEETRITVRNERQQANGKISDLEKAKMISEDDSRGFQKKLQEKVDQTNKMIDEVAKKKEVELLTI